MGRWSLARCVSDRRKRLGWLSLAAALAAAGTSLAKSKWWEAAEVGVKVHEHAFHRLTANGVGCEVRVRLYFDAPHANYKDADAERNRYRFRAELKFSGGKRFVSEVFDNSEAGARVFAFSHDTQGQGCWAEGEHKLRKLDVHACRGERCIPEVFE
jgi:hypothetical protein